MALSPAEVLAALPQQEPFRFIDAITSIDADRITAHYTFRPDHDFYRGHFPGNPVTPGVILIECMAQVSIVALGIYLMSLEGADAEREKMVTLFTDANVEFGGVVKPGERVTIEGKKVFWRRRKLRSEAELRLDDGTVVCSGTVSGMGVVR